MSDRLMPEPWFHGTNLNIPLYGPINNIGGDHIPNDGRRRLGIYVLPPFQRPFVWTDEQCMKFIESVWLGLPMAAFVVNRALNYPGYRYDGWLLDGQQRWTAIYRYVWGEYEVFGHRYPDLPRLDRREFEERTFPCIETRLTHEGKMREIYDRLAYGGTPHAR